MLLSASAACAADPVMAGTTLGRGRDWQASLFVSSPTPAHADEEPVLERPGSIVNARLTRHLTKDVRLTLDVFNVFDRRGGGDLPDLRGWAAPDPDSYLTHPAEPRGFLLGLRIRF